VKDLSCQLPGDLDAAVKSTLADWKSANKVQRVWSRDSRAATEVFQVLADRGKRALRVHLGADLEAGLAQLEKSVEQALS
jgi:hypothetical protein